MDNCTHSLVGLLVSRAFVAAPKADIRARASLIWAGILSSNLPDLDILYAGITGGKMGYLLHHRGHTHTVGLIVPLAIAAACLARVLGRGNQRGLLTRLFAVSAAGVALHLAMDSLNVYGTHPFWPFSNRWVFGDSVFIVEPMFWGLLLPIIWKEGPRWALFIGVSVGVGMLILVGSTSVIAFPIKCGLIASSLAWLWLASRMTLSKVLVASAFGCLGIVGLFAAIGTLIDARVREAVPEVYRVAKSPMPANPVCWTVWATRFIGGRYEVHKGMASVMGPSLTERWCSHGLARSVSTRFLPPSLPDSPYVLWHGAYVKPAHELKKLLSDCEAGAFMKFARIPFWEPGLVGDLRFEWGARPSFAVIELTGICPQFVPPWDLAVSIPDCSGGPACAQGAQLQLP